MSRKCDLTGVGVQTGNNVSHSNKKTRRRFLPNLHNITFRSDVLGRDIRLKVTAATLRSVEHNGGIDGFLMTTADSKLTDTAIRLKRQIKKAAAAKATKAA